MGDDFCLAFGIINKQAMPVEHHINNLKRSNCVLQENNETFLLDLNIRHFNIEENVIGKADHSTLSKTLLVARGGNYHPQPTLPHH